MLHITIGPMYAGKTTKLMELYDKQHGIILDYNIEQEEKCYRGYLINHNDVSLQCIKCTQLMDTLSVYKVKHNFQLSHDSISVFDNSIDPILNKEFYSIHDDILYSKNIYINEAQFFPDLKQFVRKLLDDDKHIYIFGLDGDFQQNKMGQIFDLIPFCDSIIKLNSKCKYCCKYAIFSHRITNDKQQYLPNEDAYIPLCRTCFRK